MGNIKNIWNIIGLLAGLVINLMITYDYFVNHKEPSNFLIYVGLMLYMQMFLKHKEKTEY
jgi:hypothetical protein